MHRRAGLILLAFVATVPSVDGASRSPPVRLPMSVPAPPERPPAGPEKRLPEASAPLPEARPVTADERDGDMPAMAPQPEPRPEPPAAAGQAAPSAAAVPANPPGDAGAASPATPVFQSDPRTRERARDPLPAEEIACRARLAELGVEFEPRPEEHDPAGCALPYPISVKRLGKDVALRPAALMNCAMAQAAAEFIRDVIRPAAQAGYGEDLAAIDQASAYVCRPRNGTTKLSEHAFGNALDIASFVLSKGTRIDVGTTPGEKGETFLGDVRKAACGPFKTVLGPGSDADHATHFHFDLAPRRRGGTFCQ